MYNNRNIKTTSIITIIRLLNAKGKQLVRNGNAKKWINDETNETQQRVGERMIDMKKDRQTERENTTERLNFQLIY